MKLIIFGDGGVGKSTLIERYVHGTFKTDTKVTIGVQFLVKRFRVDGGTSVDLQIWDFGGEDRFRFLLPAYCRGAAGGIFMFDITAPSTLYHLGDWLPVVMRREKLFPILAVGTKLDLDPHRKVRKEEEVSIARDRHLPEILEVSSKTGENVDRVFNTITHMMIDSITHIPYTMPSVQIPT